MKKIKTYGLQSRKSKVSTNLFWRGFPTGCHINKWVANLPDILKGKELKELISDIVTARRRCKPVVIMMGAHSLKCGLGKMFIQLLEEGILTGLAGNGAVAIHDVELALVGHTSEEVAEALKDGSFGMERDTPELIREALLAEPNLGFGEAVGTRLNIIKPNYLSYSILAAAQRLKVPFTIHIGLGTDIIHQHIDLFDGTELGRASYLDFKKLVEVVKDLEEGVILNVGSAVIMPETFLKALNLARNLYRKPYKFSAANLDMLWQYRPQQNVLLRPTSEGGKSYNIIGHIEIMLPLIFSAVRDELKRAKGY